MEQAPPAYMGRPRRKPPSPGRQWFVARRFPTLVAVSSFQPTSYPITLSNGFYQPDRPANRAAAHSHQCQQTRQQRGDRVKMLLPDSKVEQGKRHSTADHMTRQGLCSEQARWTLSKKLLHFFPPRG